MPVSPKRKDGPAEPFKQALATATRAVAGDETLKVVYGSDPPGLSGDTARLPYGTKGAEVVTRYTIHNARFLEEKNIKLLVVACNTASSVALPALACAWRSFRIWR